MKVLRLCMKSFSLYFISDLPVILSGEWLCFMDPQKKIWPGDPGHKYKLTNNKPENEDSFAPFKFANSCSLEFNQYYRGTLIRFPLRNEPSNISDKPYTMAELKKILEAFKADANILLLFLRYVEKVEVYTINVSGFTTMVFSVEADQNAKSIRRNKKDKFLSDVKNYESYSCASPLCLQYEVTMIVCDAQESTKRECQWTVMNWVGSTTQKISDVSKKVHSLPWLGLAVPSTPQTSSRLFCFLPMPDSDEVNPPLPVCVHGTFGLTNERRHLKWTSPDMQNDDGALWNDVLLSQMLPPCYAQCLSILKTKFNPEKFYCYWPILSVVSRTNWKIILKPLISLLLQDQLFWSQNGSWVKLQSSVYVVPQMNSGQFPQVVINALIRCGKVVVVLADRVWEAVKFIYTSNYPFTTITPSLVRQTIRNSSASYTSMSRNEKFQLLHYCLEDRNYCDLFGLALLPLVNNAFLAFHNDFKLDKVYICDTEFLQTGLLANNKAALVNVEGEDSSLHNKLIEIADSNHPQLQHLTTEVVAAMLRSLSPFQNGWCCYGDAGGFYNESWLKEFWNWVSVHSLSCFIDIPLIPVCNRKTDNGFKMVKLQKKSISCVIMYNKSVNHHPELIMATGKLGCHLTCSDEFQFLYHSELDNYVNILIPSSVLNISLQTNYKNAVFTQEEATALRHFLFQYHVVLDTRQSSVVLHLCIFPTIQTNALHSLLNAYCKVAGKSGAMVVSEPHVLNKYAFYIPQSPLVLTCEKTYIETLQSMLPNSAWFPTKLQLIVHIILVAFENNVLSREKLLNFTSTLLELNEYYSIISEPKSDFLTNKLRIFKFIPTSHNSDLLSPSEVYDPRDIIVKELFEGHAFFPIAPFTDTHFEALRKLGMKTYSTLDASDVIKIAHIICHQSNIENEIQRANKLLEYLSTDVGIKILDTYYNGMPLHKTLCSLSWLPVMVDPPEDYPTCIGWKGDTVNQFESADNLYASCLREIYNNLPYLIGSQASILWYEGTLSAKLLDSLSIPKDVPVDLMIKHTLSLVSHQHELNRNTLKDNIELLYRHLQSAVVNNCSSQDWHHLSQSEVIQISEDKFVKPSLVACSFDEKSRTVGKLEPYLYSLPSHLQQYRDLFCHVGAIKEATTYDVLSVLESISSKPNNDIGHCLELIVSILKWLCNNFTEQEIQNLILHHKILVPTSRSTEKALILKPADQVAVLDKDLQWLSDDEELLCGMDDDYFIVHNSVSYDLAHSLQLQPLSTVIANTEEFCYEQAGQFEPLTTRLNRILREYKDTSVMQELLQNADDAGATEVAVYYDTREHDTKNLLFPGMANSYGPALLFYNDAEFTNRDLKNIRKIAGETKLNEPLKIGKYGVGFCSVYHITDVPSLVSGENFLVFDPTLQCLQSEIKSEFNPGIMINFYKHRLLNKSNQLNPYLELCGFNSKQRFQGTLFRFPLRTKISTISNNVCTIDKVESMVGRLKQDSSALLMFLNNVKKISFYFVQQDSCAKYFEVIANKESVSNNVNLMTFTTYNTQASESYEEKWLVASNSQLIEINHNEKKCGIASVSVKLKADNQPNKFCIDSIIGECFCFLPLHIETGLPVHISSNFAVMTNRRGIWKADTTSTATTESNWNRMLMKSVIFQAYINLLLYLRELQQRELLNNYNFYCLWPLRIKEDNPWDLLITQFYNSVLSSEHPLFYSSVTKSWHKLSESYFLSHNILSIGFDEGLYSSMHQVVSILGISLVTISKEVWNKLESSYHFENRVIKEEDFIKLFYKDDVLVKIPITIKNLIVTASLIVFANNKHHDALPTLIKATNCIPCCPDGTVYKKPQGILNPKSNISKLFLRDEHMCPDENFLKQTDLCHQALLSLGMMNFLPWKLIVDRAKHVQNRFQVKPDECFEYLMILIGCIKENLDNNNNPSYAIKCELQKIPFLPVMQKPRHYPIRWKGDLHTLSCGPDLKKHVERRDSVNAVYACGSQVFILDTKFIPPGLLTDKVIKFLGITRDLREVDVANHFALLLKTFNESSLIKSNDSLLQATESIVKQVYRYWENHINSDSIEGSVSYIKGKACIWHVRLKEFLCPSRVSFEWSTDGPFLHQFPSTIPSSLKPLMEFFGVKQDFSSDVMLNVLGEMKQKYEGNPIPWDCQEVVRLILPKLNNISIANTKVFLPDENFILRDTKTLKYNDASWSDSNEDFLFCHGCIEKHTAVCLGVMPVRSLMLEDLDITNELGEEFGQEEQLTQRLNNILRDYPRDITLLKELLQNADDAGATKLFIILDKRYHSDDKVISENWKQLQGPALLFWNNSTFSKKDFIGIQRLGLGSKRDDADKIGQYGIGFNVVYHYTDCPSFITDDKLCVLDPHYRYVTHNKRRKPGRLFGNLRKLWSEFPDMRLPYLQNELHKFPIIGGSLFRLPLKLSKDMAELSEIVKDVVDLQQIEEDLKDWFSHVAEILLFLRHVSDVRLFIINDTIELQVCTSSTRGRERVIKTYEKAGLVMFPIKIVTNSPATRQRNEENWLVQFGEGNVEEPEFDWSRIMSTGSGNHPRHGIAALLGTENLKGRSFCFLPLPGETNLPVHIHGQFVLSSDRSGIWIYRDNNGSGCREPNSDPKANWNAHLYKAIGVAYAHFLINYPIHEEVLPNSLHTYYKLFPNLTLCKTEPWSTIAQYAYAMLIHLNPPILSTIVRCSEYESIVHCPDDAEKFAIEWHNLYQPNTPDEPHFCQVNDDIVNLLRSLGMNITEAPAIICEHFNNVSVKLAPPGKQIPTISVESVIKYYNNFCSLIYNGNQLPCDLASTKFKTTDFFIKFLKFLMKWDNCFSEEIEKSNNFYSLGFIITADGKLHSLSDGKAIISSDHWKLFLNSTHCFVHDDLRVIYDTHSKYLMERIYDQNHIKHLTSIINDNFHLSWDRKSTQVSYTYEHKQDANWIQNMLYCLTHDPVFSMCCNDLLKMFPLLPADNGISYSTASDILPMKNSISNSDPKPEYSIDEAKRLMGKLEIPLLRHELSSSILKNIKIQLPSLLVPDNILKSLYLVKKHTFFNAYEMLSENDLILLFKILKMVSYSSVSNQEYIKELPIFTTMDGKLVSLSSASQVWIWNDKEVCTTGIDQWINRITDNIIFVNPFAPWSCLKHEAENLGMFNINKYDMYCNFIFPNFHFLDSVAQLDHLIFIRTDIYPECKQILENSGKSSNMVKNFVTALKSLQCIPDHTGALRTIESLYDHNEKIFQIFCDESCFLPNQFRDSKWYGFFKYFELKTVPTYKEFMWCCKRLPNLGNISAITAGSEVLLNVLFDVSNAGAKKYEDIHLPQHLQEISQIPIAVVDKLPDLNCIKEQKMGEIEVTSSMTLAKLHGSTLTTNSYLVWTILPLIKTPHNNESSSKSFSERLECLGIVQSPCLEDVISNLRNLSTSSFTRYDAFEKHCMTSSGSLLPNIVVKMMEYLQAKLQHNDGFEETCNKLESQLSHVNFLPVKLPIENTKAYALVKPIQVLCVEPSEVTPYYPFLHPLIEEANGVIKLLSKLGVKRSFHPFHIQFVLQSIKDLCQDNEVVFNNKGVVIKATEKLIDILHHVKNTSDAISQLKPLYLLNQENVLTECSKLIVNNITHHFPPPKGYAYLHLFNDSIKELPHLLPEELGLKNLRSITTYELIDNKPAREVYSNVLVIKEILLSSAFKSAIEIYSSCCNQGTILPCVTEILTEFQSKLTVQVLITVKAKPKIKIDDKSFVIDDVKEHSFFLQRSVDQHWILSLKNTQNHYRAAVFTKFANQLCSRLQLKSIKCLQSPNNDDIPTLTEFVCHILQCSSISKISEVIREHLPGMHDIQMDSFIIRDPVLGDVVPERLHYMLDQSMFNFFYPEEWVGYEDEHGNVVCAQILCEVIHEKTIPTENNFQRMMERRYVISLGLNEPNIEVSALQLYKFIQNKSAEHEKSCGITEMDFFDGPSTSEHAEQSTNIKIDSEKKAKSKAIDKKSIREAVKAAWALPEEQRRKAIKRLWLDYHPDKNPDNPNATAEFQFLQQEIERMEKGISEDEADGGTTTSSRSTSHSQWHSWFNQWNHTASSHSYFRGSGMPGGWNIPRTQPNLTESKRWIGQARYDYSALCALKNASQINNEVSAATCFMCHEVAERSLKAGLYAKRGMGEVSLKNHDLILPASALIQLGCPIDINDAKFLERFYLDTRFPNRYPPPTIPGEQFSYDIAKQAFDAATRIYEMMKQLIVIHG